MELCKVFMLSKVGYNSRTSSSKLLHFIKTLDHFEQLGTIFQIMNKSCGILSKIWCFAQKSVAGQILLQIPNGIFGTFSTSQLAITFSCCGRL